MRPHGRRARATPRLASPIRRVVLRHVLRSPARAFQDAARAWIVTPQFSARCAYATGERGERQLTSRRAYTVRERIVGKIRAACRVFWHGLRLRLARNVCIRRIDDEGFMANLLHVLEVLQRVRPDARVHVDWSLTGTERGFRYGRAGDNVWTGLFKPLDPQPSNGYVRADVELDFALWGTGKDYLTEGALQQHRQAYYRTLVERVEVTNTRVLDAVRETYERSLRGRFSIGIHRRVSNAMLPSLQRDGVAPSIERFIEYARRNIPAHPAEWAVFLATDDADTVPPLRRAFGPRLVVREPVQRTTADQPEVHFRDWGRLSLADAEDVLIDTLLLARCDVLVHASSSISTMAGLLNPALCLVRVGRAM